MHIYLSLALSLSLYIYIYIYLYMYLGFTRDELGEYMWRRLGSFAENRNCAFL